MTREQVLNSISLKKRFCKDCNLPINLFDEPYFSERLKTLDVIFDCVMAFEIFCAELESYNSEQEYFEYYNAVKDSVINMIKDNSDFCRFINDPFTDVNKVRKSINIPNRSLYSDDNCGKMFVSIDMKKANFSALRHYCPDIFKNMETWEEYIGSFTHSEHIKNSKYIRQVILGACNPKRQVTYESYLMSIVYLHLKDVLGDGIDVLSLSNDELIIVDYGMGITYMNVIRALQTCPYNINLLLRCELFKLDKVGDYGWKKDIYRFDGDGGLFLDEVVFKGIQAEIYHQIIKHYYGQEITENDLVFRYNGALAKYLKEVDNPWKR